MNRSAYLTTGLAIKTLSRLSKARIAIHGQEHLPDAPVVFVINHFTRIETFLLPYHLFVLTGTPIWSLANADLFQGGFAHFLELVGAVSTRDPLRDELIIKTLLTGEANWIIFPEGSMIKTKKIMHGSNYMVANPKGMRQPHTGAATLALRTELFRRYLLLHAQKGSPQVGCTLDYLELKSLEEVLGKSPMIVPVNLTYYPIRAHENFASTLAEKMIKDVSGRLLEELMTEGTMLFSGVDLDIRFGPPIDVAAALDAAISDRSLLDSSFSSFIGAPFFSASLRKAGKALMQRYMHSIYTMTTVNHEHLFAAFLRMYPYKKIKVSDLQRRVYYGSLLLQRTANQEIYLHKSLQEDQSHLVSDDRFAKCDNFFQLARDKGIVSQEGEMLVRDRSKLSAPVSFHRGRIDNPVEVIANEVEPLKILQKVVFSLAWQPDFLIRLTLSRYLLRKAREEYQRALLQWGDQSPFAAKPQPQRFYPSLRRRTGIVLVHSYLANPGEVEQFGRYLRGLGYWVYLPRLAGHGTCAADLAQYHYQDWLNGVEQGYALLRNLCSRVVLGGLSVGGCLALHLASRVSDLAGVFSLAAPSRLKDYSSRFMPSRDVRQQMVRTMKGTSAEKQFLAFSADQPHINYSHNPVHGIREVGRLLEDLRPRLAKVTTPTLLIHGAQDSLVSAKGSRRLFEGLGSRRKEYCLLGTDRHILTQGDDREQVLAKVRCFLAQVRRGTRIGEGQDRQPGLG
ncbi:alpha/beta fold hydrolase [Desulfogranum mediterraneum]|uniref:alpha/beta fold hydrolase n=1 Tax=Desulfogranum mediterraneum TaxID=160661 RepID=UPI00042050BD|nr:alpha/beta fold hydrolase [Desulfogranum mediterraneum]